MFPCSGSDSEPDPTRELSVADMRKVMASILDVLECPVCYQELYSPIFQCNNGHPVCATCRPRVRACPVCKSWMYHVRALTLEKIVRELPRPCRYMAGGCTERLGAANRAHHERCCPRRPARCVEALVACGWKGPLPEARAHLWKEHELAGRLHRAMHGRFSFSVGCVGQEKFLEDTAESVLFRCLIRAERGKLHFLCHALVAADRAGMYVFRVLVTNRCSERRLSYEGPVPSVFQSVNKTIEASQGLRVGRDWLLKACSCRAGELCFDTTWQLSRRAELLEADRDLSTLLAGAYPEPHSGSHDLAINATPHRMRPEARIFTPSRSQQVPQSVTPSGSREAQSVTPSGSREAQSSVTPSGSREAQSVTPSGSQQMAQSVTPSGSREAQSDITSRSQQMTQSVTPSGSRAEPGCTSQEQTLHASTAAVRQELLNDAPEDAALPSSQETDTGTEEQLPSLAHPERLEEPTASDSTSEEEPGAASASAPEGEPSAQSPDPPQSSAVVRLPVASEVSAACYAAAVARLASAITSRLTGASYGDTGDTEDTEVTEPAACRSETAAASGTATPQPDAVRETASAQAETAAARPEVTSDPADTPEAAVGSPMAATDTQETADAVRKVPEVGASSPDTSVVRSS